MRLLITGGCGFLGSNLASNALRHGYELVVFDSLYREGSQLNLQWLKDQGEFRFVHGDIRFQNDITKIVQEFKPELVFHLAGQVAMTVSINNPQMDFQVNTIGTHNLLEAIRLNVPEAIVIYSSTNKVYGDLDQFRYKETKTRYECIDKPNGFDETTPLSFQSPYGCSKGAADQYMIDYARIFGLNTVVFRHSSMYGGRQFSTFDQGWVGWFCRQGLEVTKGKQKEPFSISGTGKQVRDVLHSDDMINLYFLAAGNINLVKGRAFNIGGGVENSLSLLELFIMLEEKLNVRLNYVQLPERISDQKVFVADISKVKKILGWQAHINARDGVCDMLKWLDRQP